MDPGYPDERIKYILTDTNAKVVLTNEVYQLKLEDIVHPISGAVKASAQVSVIAIDDNKLCQQLAAQPVTNLDTGTISTNLAYVIYTSGTTGHPKGVMIEHKGVVNTVFSLDNTYDFIKGNKVSAFTSYVFDVSVSEFFVALFKGAALYLLCDKIRADSGLISKYIIDNNINYLYLPPALLSSLPKIKYETLEGVIYAGEPCDIETGKYWSNHYKLYNYYGPTEVTIYASGQQ